MKGHTRLLDLLYFSFIPRDDESLLRNCCEKIILLLFENAISVTNQISEVVVIFTGFLITDAIFYYTQW